MVIMARLTQFIIFWAIIILIIKFWCVLHHAATILVKVFASLPNLLSLYFHVLLCPNFGCKLNINIQNKASKVYACLPWPWFRLSRVCSIEVWVFPTQDCNVTTRYASATGRHVLVFGAFTYRNLATVTHSWLRCMPLESGVDLIPNYKVITLSCHWYVTNIEKKLILPSW